MPEAFLVPEPTPAPEPEAVDEASGPAPEDLEAGHEHTSSPRTSRGSRGARPAGGAEADRVIVTLLVALVGAVVSFLMSIVMWRVGIRFKLYPEIRARDVHTRPTPRLGGVAMFAGCWPPCSSPP